MGRLGPVVAGLAVVVLFAVGCGRSEAESSDATAGAPAPDGSSVVTGTVVDSAGDPASDVLITPISVGDPPNPVPEKAVLTGADGTYEWTGLAEGDYEISGSREGSSTNVVQVRVGSEPATADLELSD
ncbi:carboxypeptidase regulatory-like domain-containing protein [Spiractinospora alimapuensis]|uniref:carboxypeptidase-like regulatory domain-containing protein n=1 Tax=Spiractinospora alimapuensis TaxID=2820884 RepID=UPI001F2149D5|nr:carboxypeptidase-like regulatory domain-containing protein [Spiractinospora alimapuensis]QVQ51919.1 carboxypeptidase regulatory-like domain-containing protein [Spiractinospora alimapuensis]